MTLLGVGLKATGLPTAIGEKPLEDASTRGRRPVRGKRKLCLLRLSRPMMRRSVSVMKMWFTSLN